MIPIQSKSIIIFDKVQQIGPKPGISLVVLDIEEQAYAPFRPLCSAQLRVKPI